MKLNLKFNKTWKNLENNYTFRNYTIHLKINHALMSYKNQKILYWNGNTQSLKFWDATKARISGKYIALTTCTIKE